MSEDGAKDEDEGGYCPIFEVWIDKIRDRYSVDVSAAHQLPCTVPAAEQSPSADKQSVQTQPVERKSIINIDISQSG